MSPDPVILAGRYVCEAPVSRGGMATVWRARDDVLARTVAVKILHAHLAEDAAFLERFRREALAAARLTHPNIISIFDSGSEAQDGESKQHFIVMEYCGNGTLASILERDGPLTPHRVASIAATICDALSYAHRAGVVHRDVKPANVLIAADGTLKVADFGIAKAAFVAKDVTTTGNILGTVTYLSPEQARGEEPDARSDLYSLGVVAYELLVGRPPFAGETQIATAMMHVKDPPPPPRSVRANVPRQLEATILKALAKNPDDRFSSADDMRTALLATASDTDRTATFTPPPRASEPAPAGSAGDVRWIVAAFALIVIAVAAALAFSGAPDNPTGASPERSGSATEGSIRVREVNDFDPYGGGEEHSDKAGLAADGDPATAWDTEGYNDPFELIGKPGVGLVLDLGRSVAVDRVVVTASPDMAVELRASDEPAGDESGFELIASEQTGETTTFDAGGSQGRYWLVWITSLPGGGAGSASISEVEFFGP
jgi:serine/threonine-protein kinase